MARRRKKADHEMLLDAKERTLLRFLSEGYDFEALSTTMNMSQPTILRDLQDILRKMIEEGTMAFLLVSPSGMPRNDDRRRILSRSLGERQIERSIQKLKQRALSTWSCLYIVDMSPKISVHEERRDKIGAPFSEFDLITHLRHYDLVVQWLPHEWVIFMPFVSHQKIPGVLGRIRDLVTPCAIGWGSADIKLTVDEVLGKARERALIDLTDRTLGNYLKPPPSPLC